MRAASTTNDLTKATESWTRSRHAEVARRYAWQAMRRRRGGPPIKLITMIRLRELERLYRHRWGRYLPDDDAGRDDLILAAHHIAQLHGEVENHILGWIGVWCPWMPQDEAEALAKKVASNPLKYKAATLGWRLGLTDQERSELAITTIRAFNVTAEQMAERRKRIRREREAKRRRLKRAARPRPISHQNPWQAQGISRATWYRRRKLAGETGRETKAVASRVTSIAGHGICLTLPAADEDDHLHCGHHLGPIVPGGCVNSPRAISEAMSSMMGGGLLASVSMIPVAFRGGLNG